MTIFGSDTLNWTTSGQLDETELTIQEDKDGWFEGCPKCKTDSHLMDLEEKESNLMDKYRDVGMSPSDFM